jgi:hypothetical protein
MDITDLLFALNRPEYPKNPEVLQSALAWSLEDRKPTAKTGKGLVYEQISPSISKSIEILQSRPNLADSIRLLDDIGLVIGSGAPQDERMGDSLWNQLRAVSAQKAKAYSAVPITPGATMLQDAIGVHAKAGPPNFAEIIEQVYRAGAHQPVPSREAARRWYQAISAYKGDQLLEFLDAVAGRLLEALIGRNPLPGVKDGAAAVEEPVGQQPQWLKGVGTPMRWFHESWNVLCSEEWRRALPPQRWADWASCVLRTAIALTFLWEARFFQRLGRILLSDHPTDQVKALVAMPLPLLRWRESGLPISVRDENSRLIRTVLDGTRIRALLGEILVAHAPHGGAQWHMEKGLEKFTEWFCKETDLSSRFREDLSDCFGSGKFSAANNVLETIRYLLLARAESGRQADFYGVLRRRSGRFLVVSPGEEWMVVVASLAAGSPGKKCTLGRLRTSLSALGIYAEREQVIQELERAGLSRSSHDADDAIVVWSGF